MKQLDGLVETQERLSALEKRVTDLRSAVVVLQDAAVELNITKLNLDNQSKASTLTKEREELTTVLQKIVVASKYEKRDEVTILQDLTSFKGKPNGVISVDALSGAWLKRTLADAQALLYRLEHPGEYTPPW